MTPSMSRFQVIRVAALSVLASSFTQLGLSGPGRAHRAPAPERGHITTADGRLLAHDTPSGRVYPQNELAASTVGFTGADGGLEGVEYRYDDALKAGKDITLTLDSRLQLAVERVLGDAARSVDAEFGSAVVLDVATGRILAAASVPGFDVNAWSTAPSGRWRNRALLDEYEPGSVMKPLIVAALLNEGATTPTTVYDTPMRRRVGRATIGDSVAHPATLTTQQILRYSSNVGMTHLVENWAPNRMHRALQAYGFGRAAPLGMPTGRGQLRPPAAWDDVIRATSAFGQGLTVTTVQLAAAFNVVAGDGQYRAPTLVAGTDAVARPVLRPEVAATMRTMLHAVVDEALSRQAGLPGYHMGGKTGTAQVVEQGRYSDTIFSSTFAGFLPVDRPRYTVAVMVRGAKRNYHGSQLAAPVFRDIAAEVISLTAMAPQPPHGRPGD